MKVSAGPIKALLVDWDGTLIDSLPLKIANASALFADRFGITEADVSESYAKHSGVPRRILFNRIGFDTIGRELTEDEFKSLSEAFTERNTNRVASEGNLRTGSLQTLSQLRERGALLFISTSAAQEEIDPLAKHFGLDRICTDIFGSKPSFSKGREHALRVMDTFGLSERNLAGVGDDVQDMILFQDAKILAIGITGTRTRRELEEAGASIVIDRFDEVLSHVA